VERVLTVEFGPSRSKRFAKAVAEARGGAGECSELEPRSYRVRFALGSEGRVYTSLARLLQRVRDWRAIEVYERDQLVSSYHAREMSWCAAFYLSSFGACRERFASASCRAAGSVGCSTPSGRSEPESGKSRHPASACKRPPAETPLSACPNPTSRA
jgi:hypothetical protein